MGKSFLFPLLFSIAIVPILVLPWFVDAYEVHKVTVAIVASLIAGTLFLVHVARTKELRLLWSWPLVFLGIFFLVTVVSACFSVYPAASWLGIGGGDYASVLFVGSCVLMSFLLAQASAQSAFLLKYVRVVWAVEGLLMTGALLLIFTGIFSFSPVLSFGAPHALALFFGIATLCSLGGIAMGSAGRAEKIAGYVLLASFLIVSFLLDAWVLWLPSCVAGVALLLCTLVPQKKQISMSHVLPGVLLVILSFVGWILPPIFQGFFPVEIVPSFSLSTDIVTSVWHNGFGFFVGSGPGTYGISYALYALPTVNATAFWNVVFDRGFSHILTLATTGGLLTAFTFVLLQISGIVAGFRSYACMHASQRGNMLGIYLAFVFLSVSAWTYAWNTPLVFIMFVLFGLLLSIGSSRTVVWSFVSSSRSSLVAVLSVVALGIVSLLAFFVTGTRYAAEITYAQAIAQERKGAAPEDVIAKVDQAASFNRWNDVYYRELSLLLLQRINALVEAHAPTEQIQLVLGSAVHAAVRATEIGPRVVQNWEVRGNVYREVAPAIDHAADFSVTSFLTATELAPNNPLYFVGLGRAYTAQGDLFAQNTSTEDAALKADATTKRDAAFMYAENAFTKAIALKGDYPAAYYFLSAVYEREGSLVDAVQAMETVRALQQSDVGVGMQLSLLYLRQEKNDLAQAELERIIRLSPNYANAHWYLSVLLEQAGDIEGAIAEVAEVAKANPDNEAVQQRLNRLQSGEVQDDAALPDPLPEETPETISEIPSSL